MHSVPYNGSLKGRRGKPASIEAYQLPIRRSCDRLKTKMMRRQC